MPRVLSGRLERQVLAYVWPVLDAFAFFVLDTISFPGAVENDEDRWHVKG